MYFLKNIKIFFTGISEIGFQSFDPFVVNEIKLDNSYGIIKTKGTWI